jgi:hypothetical protein
MPGLNRADENEFSCRLWTSHGFFVVLIFISQRPGPMDRIEPTHHTRWISLCTVIMLTLPAMSQETLMTLFGTVKDHTTGEPIENISVHAFDVNDPTHELQATTRGDGKYEVLFTEERTYQVVFTAPGRVPKQIELALAGPTEDQWEGGFGMNIDINLFRELPDLDLTLGGEPFGRSRFEPGSGTFEWDAVHAGKTKERMAKVVKIYEARVDAGE